MVLTRDFKETVKERAARDPAFAKAMLDEAATAFLNGEPHVARLILREFPLDGLAVAAFMLARCAGPDRYYPMVDALFETQKTWAMPGTDGKEKLLIIAKQAGFSKEKFDQCLADKELFDKIVETRKIAHEKFGVDSTPSFFVNGKRLKGEHQLKDFETALAGGTVSSDGASRRSSSRAARRSARSSAATKC